MLSVEELRGILSDSEKAWLCSLWYNSAELKERIEFIKIVLVGRHNLNIKGWDMMDYNLKLQVLSNKLFKERTFVV